MSAQKKLLAVKAAEEAIRAIPLDDETSSHRSQALWAMVTLGDDLAIRMRREGLHSGTRDEASLRFRR